MLELVPPKMPEWKKGGNVVLIEAYQTRKKNNTKPKNKYCSRW
jgi:hypothetical protein